MAASKSPDGGAAGGSWPGGRKLGESRPMAFSRLRHLARRFWNQTCTHKHKMFNTWGIISRANMGQDPHKHTRSAVGEPKQKEIFLFQKL